MSGVEAEPHQLQCGMQLTPSPARRDAVLLIEPFFLAVNLRCRLSVGMFFIPNVVRAWSEALARR
jgi:hypothetical protein